MTISSTTTPRVQYNGNGSTTAFSVSFVFSTYVDLQVYLTDISTGVETLQTYTTHYTVSGGGGSGTPATGTVTFVTAPASGKRITILRSVANKQTVDYVENDAFPAQSHELALDRLTMQLQDVRENLDRAIVFTPGSTTTDISVGTPIADAILRWDSTATTITTVSADTVAAPISLSAAGLISCTSLTPRTYAGRTLTAPAAGITVSNGDGVSGNPTLALANDLSALEGLSSTGIAVRTGSDTWAQRTVTGTTNQISVTNGSGAAGDPTLALSSTLIAPGTIESTTTITAGTNLIVKGANELRLNNSGNTFYTGFKAPTLAANTIYTLPTADGTSGQAIVTNGAGVLSWGSITSSQDVVKISSTTVAGSPTSITFTGLSTGTYKQFMLVLDPLVGTFVFTVTGTNASNPTLTMQLYDDGSLISSANYGYVLTRNTSGTVAGTSVNYTATSFPVADAFGNLRGASTAGTCYAKITGQILLNSLSGASIGTTTLHGKVDSRLYYHGITTSSTTGVRSTDLMGSLSTAATVANGISLTWTNVTDATSATFTNGSVIHLYGIK